IYFNIVVSVLREPEGTSLKYPHSPVQVIAAHSPLHTATWISCKPALNPGNGLRHSGQNVQSEGRVSINRYPNPFMLQAWQGKKVANVPLINAHPFWLKIHGFLI
ncbi:MAG: hypothetical protein P8X63_14400, partial [Desulfuromonadaceae bacterium]